MAQAIKQPLRNSALGFDSRLTRVADHSPILISWEFDDHVSTPGFRTSVSAESTERPEKNQPLSGARKSIAHAMSKAVKLAGYARTAVSRVVPTAPATIPYRAQSQPAMCLRD
ncbi:hypothetical protein LTR53_008484 [Teratosphaeriaceae sp. CCFEE 6253]|nr:hypothetical protein LTR53_008484 [Teratosphaeriaceae sp. CCFEE 6253]